MKKSEDSESDFIRLLENIQANRASSEELLVHPLFNSRLRLIAMAVARTTQDADDLANDVRFKVWRYLQHFQPKGHHPYLGFFNWLRTLTQRTFLDSLRRSKAEFVELDDEQVQALNIQDPRIDIEASVLYREVLVEFEKSINALPERDRLAIAYYFQGFSFREISGKMRQAGFSYSHVTVGNLIRKVLSVFIHQTGVFPNIRSKNIRATKVRATRAKKEFHNIVEQAINSGTRTVVPEDTQKTSSGSSKITQSNSRPGWEAANELLKRMQSPESSHGIQAAFEASPEALGRMAVEQANKSGKVSVSSLTTFLMATSTANVVGRVMNLTKDVT